MRGTVLAIIALIALAAAPARAAPVTYDGTADGEAWSLALDARGPDPWLLGQYGYFDLVLTVGTERYELSELIYSFGTNVYVDPYPFTISGNAVTLDLPDARGNDLATLTLTYAEAFSGTLTVANLLAYLIETPLEGVRGLRRNGRELFDIAVEPPVPVPAPPALALFASGLLLTRRLRRN